jgi:hypothetical protein
MPNTPIRPASTYGSVVRKSAALRASSTPGRGVFEKPRLAAARPLVGRVEDDGHEPVLGQPAGIDADGLLLHPTRRVDADQRRIPPVLAEVSGQVKVPGQLDALVLE